MQLLPVVLIAFGLTLSSLAPVQSAETGDIIDVATEAGSFKTLAVALEAAGLVETLQGDGPYTVFAPTDDAFAKLPAGMVKALLEPANKQKLVDILTLHVVPGRYEVTRALAARSLDSVQGQALDLQLTKGTLTVNGVRVVDNDVRASNGVIHAIDTVLIPDAASSPERAVFDLFELAIARGVPLFNAGQHAGCASVYEVAVRSVTDRPGDLTPEPLKGLRRALDAIEGSRDSAENAWTLRRAMDRTMAAWVSSQARSELTPTASSGNLTPVFDFAPSDDPWVSLNDDVMGGISQSKFTLTASGSAFFQGALSLENNGGFATIRSKARDLDLGKYAGLVLRVRGDGRTYGISGLPSSQRWEVDIWQTDFATKPGEWMEIRVPFESLEYRVMGRRFAGRTLDPSTILSLAFSISDKNEEPFELEIDWIKAYRNISTL